MQPLPFATRLRALAREARSPALFAYAINGSAAVASFGATVFLARGAGAAVVGHYALAATTANMLATVALIGLDRIVLREVAGDLREGVSGRARGKLRAMARCVLAVSGAVSLLYLAAVLLSPLAKAMGADPMAMVAVTVGILVWPLLRLSYSGIRAAGSPILGQVFEALPTLLFASAIFGLAMAAGIQSAGQVTAIFVGMQALAAGLAAWILWKRTQSWGAAEAIAVTPYLRAGAAIMFTAFLQIFSDWLLLAILASRTSPAEAGAFRVAYQVVGISMLVVATTETYVAAKIAGDFRAGRPDLLWRRHRRATVLMLILASPILLAALLVPDWLMLTAFGPEFAIAAAPLSIMAIGQIFNVLRGPIGSVLVMTGHQAVQLWMTLAGVALLVVLALLLIPLYGLKGAAIAYTAPIILRSLISYFVARRLLPDVPPAASPPLAG